MENERDPREQYANWKAPETTETQPSPVEVKKPTLRQIANEYTRNLRDQFSDETEENQTERDYIRNIDKQLAKIRPDKPPQDFEVADALAGAAYDNAVVRENLAQAQDLPKEELDKYGKEQATAKALLMEAGKVVYPEATPLGLTRADFVELSKELDTFYRNFSAISPNVEGLGSLVSLKGQSGAEKDLIAKRNPQEVIRVLDHFTAQASQILKEYARLNYDAELDGKDERQLAGQRGMLAEFVKLIYRMELARDAVAQNNPATPEQETKAQSSEYESITDANFEVYRTQGKEVLVNGDAWSISDAQPDGRVIIKRQRTTQEILDMINQDEKSSFLPSTLTRAGALNKSDLKSGGRWVLETAPRSPKDASYQTDKELLDQLEAKVTSGIFDKRQGELDLLRSFVDANRKRLDQEKQRFEGKK